VHKVLLLLLTVPIPDFDLLAFPAVPPEGIPTVDEGGHSTDLRHPGHVVQAECGHLITGGCNVDVCIDEVTDLGAFELHFDGSPRSNRAEQVLAGVGGVAGGAARVGEIRFRRYGSGVGVDKLKG